MRPDHGDVTAEYLALRDGTGVLDGHSELVWVRGPEAVSFLDGQVSQDVAAMPPGTTARSFLLEPRGKLVGLLWLLRGEEEVGLVCDGGTASDIAAHLERFRFRVDAEIFDEPEPSREVWAIDSTALPPEGLDVGDGWRRVGDGVVALLRGSILQRLILVGHVDDRFDDFVQCGRVAADTVRIESGEPVTGVDVDGSTIPQESGLVPDAVSFTKGCFVGQELVARIDARGRVNRRLAGVVVGANTVPPVGAVVVHDDAEVGALTTVGESLTLRAPVGMGMVRREVDDGDDVELRWDGGSVAAQVRDLPLVGAG